jgi:hypothetical protein
MYACVDCCHCSVCDKFANGQCGCLNRCFPKPFSFITTILVSANVIFIALTIIFLIIESLSPDFSCPRVIISHPIVMICVSAINIVIYILIFCYNNSPPLKSNERPPSVYFLRKLANLLCYKIAFCFYYLYVVGFIIFVILGETIIKAQNTECLHSFRITLIMDTVLMAIFFCVIFFGVFFVCCGINYNSKDGCGTIDTLKFILNLFSCGVLFKDYFENKKRSGEEARDMYIVTGVTNQNEQQVYMQDSRPKESKGKGMLRNFKDIWND